MTATAWLTPLRHPSPEAFENYLAAQAARGRHLQTIDVLSPLRMRFDEGAPEQVRYVLDRRAQPVPTDYFTFREDLGWEHVGSVGEQHVWRQSYTDVPPPRFKGTDVIRRARTASVAAGVVAALALLGAVALGILALVDPVSAASASDFAIPAIVLAVIGVAAAAASRMVSVSRRAVTAERVPELL